MVAPCKMRPNRQPSENLVDMQNNLEYWKISIIVMMNDGSLYMIDGSFPIRVLSDR